MPDHPRPPHPQVTAADVRAFLELMDTHGIRMWLDDGWAVAALRGRGFAPVPHDDTRPWSAARQEPGETSWSQQVIDGPKCNGRVLAVVLDC